MLIVQKFGGTSLSDPQRILSAAAKAIASAGRDNQVVVVVSAQGHTTDRLLQTAAPLDPDPRELDAYLAAGEQLSAGLMAMAIAHLGHRAVSLTGWQAGLSTDGVHGNARPLGLQNQRIRRELDQGKIVVVAGFQGIGPDADVTTLGRGGSDTTAVALAAYLKADKCQIYTDVDGVYDQDPRLYPDATKYYRLSYEKMLALIQKGAQVLHDRSVELGRDHGIPIQVLSSFRPGPGTMVGPWE